MNDFKFDPKMREFCKEYLPTLVERADRGETEYKCSDGCVIDLIRIKETK